MHRPTIICLILIVAVVLVLKCYTYQDITTEDFRRGRRGKHHERRHRGLYPRKWNRRRRRYPTLWGSYPSYYIPSNYWTYPPYISSYNSVYPTCYRVEEKELCLPRFIKYQRDNDGDGIVDDNDPWYCCS